MTRPFTPSINRFRLDDLHPHIYRTHDGGKTWKKIVEGIPDNEVVNTVREDPVRKGMLFAGTERAVYVSFDDGDHWQPLRLNLPATSIRDLVIHGDDRRRGDPRPLVLDSRRHHAAAADRMRHVTSTTAFSSSRRSPIASRATVTPIRRCRRKCRRARIRRTARFSITI